MLHNDPAFYDLLLGAYVYTNGLASTFKEANVYKLVFV